jgi:hypothetical protein
MLLAAGLSWGQTAPNGNGNGNGNSNGKGKIRREVVNEQGRKAHILLSAPLEKQLKGENAPCLNPPPTPSCTATAMAYSAKAGPVMRNPTNYLIFWAPSNAYNAPGSFPAGYQAGIEKFIQNLGGTPYYNIVTQYNDSSGVPVPNALSLGAPSWTDTTTATPSGNNGKPGDTGTCTAPNCPLTDADIQAEIGVALAANPSWQVPGINVEYFVYTPTGIDECFSNTSCFAITGGTQGAFCAYHSFNGSTIYAYMPFASGGACGGVTPFPDGIGGVLDLVLSPTQHEMMESNTDPNLNAWFGTDGLSDEIGDKCSYDYGFIAPDGTSVVLNGNRYQIQQEFSNDALLSAGAGLGCTKRYGLAPAVATPAPVVFAEVQDGTSAQQNLQIQNNGAGDLNILDVRLGGGTSFLYSLLDPQPTAATLHSSEGLTEQIQFAPTVGSSGNPTGTIIVDTDQTACTEASGSGFCQTSTTFDTITGTAGFPPLALCAPAVVHTDLNLCSTANASINNGSHDADGESVSLIQSPAGPYTLGITPVSLTVTDNGPDMSSATCASTVTVQDLQIPSITCPAAATVQCTSSSGAAVSVVPTYFDNCPAVTESCVPTSGSSFGFGTTPVTCTATDASGNKNSCMTSVTVNDVPPVIASVVASPALLSPPNKKLVPVTISVKDSDACDPNPVCAITTVTANQIIPASDIKITGPLTVSLANAGTGGHPLTYIVTVKCTDAHGGSTSAQTSVISE